MYGWERERGQRSTRSRWRTIPPRWEALGFTLDGASCRLGGVVARAARAPARDGGSLEWSLRGVASTELDGLADDALRAARGRAPRPSTPTARSAVDHVVAMSPSLDRTVAALQAAGLDLRRIREEPTPAGAPRQAFFRLGEVILEVVQEPDEVARAPRRPRSPGAPVGAGAAVRRPRPRGGDARRGREPGARGRPARAPDSDGAPLGGTVGAAGADEHPRSRRGARLSWELWNRVDEFVGETLLDSDPVLEAALEGERRRRACRRSPCPRRRAGSCSCWPASTAPARSSSSARSAATARSCWRGRCRRTGAW